VPLDDVKVMKHLPPLEVADAERFELLTP
jgi:hypothetical protein